MKIKLVEDIILSDIIDGKTEIEIKYELCNGEQATRRGKYYEDHILEMTDKAISGVTFCADTNSCTITLKKEGENA